MGKIKKINVVDLFAGIGGFSKGFERAGFKVVLGIDNWDVALKTFERNHSGSESLCEDLTKINDQYYKNIKTKTDILIAGPPCQGFSMSGTRQIGDARNDLFKEVVRAAKITDPEVVIIENVVGILSMKNTDGILVKDIIKETLEKLGYHVNYTILKASDYGVPQARRRVVFVGTKKNNYEFPDKNKEKVKVKDAFGNLPDVNKNKYLLARTIFQKMMQGSVGTIHNHEAMSHNEKVLNRIKHVPQGGNWKDIPPKIYDVGGEHSNNYRRLDPNKPSITIKHAAKSMIIHPFFDRVITAREAARLQSFDDDFIIEGSKSEQQQQLANAVPPLLGYAIAKSVKKYLSKK